MMINLLACLSAPQIFFVLIFWSLPFLAIAAMVIAIPVGIVRGIAVHRTHTRTVRVARGLCPVCGYDLCATPDRCSECGFVPSTSRIASNDWPTIELD